MASSTASTIRVAAKSNPANFKKALNRLSTDKEFRDRAIAKPEILTTEFRLSLKELHALRAAAVLSGADLTEIQRVRGNAIERFAVTRTNVADVDIDISCCCCCCCGETSVVSTYA